MNLRILRKIDGDKQIDTLQYSVEERNVTTCAFGDDFIPNNSISTKWIDVPVVIDSNNKQEL